jgi:site-specific recombinase XerD
MTFGEKPVADITTGDIEADRHHRRERKRSAVTINHDLKLLRKMFAWGIRERLRTATPFKVAGESVIRLDPESLRAEGLTSEEAELKLFEAASPYLRGGSPRCSRRAAVKARSCRSSGTSPAD